MLITVPSESTTSGPFTLSSSAAASPLLGLTWKQRVPSVKQPRAQGVSVVDRPSALHVVSTSFAGHRRRRAVSGSVRGGIGRCVGQARIGVPVGDAGVREVVLRGHRSGRTSGARRGPGSRSRCGSTAILHRASGRHECHAAENHAEPSHPNSFTSRLPSGARFEGSPRRWGRGRGAPSGGRGHRDDLFVSGPALVASGSGRARTNDRRLDLGVGDSSANSARPGGHLRGTGCRGVDRMPLPHRAAPAMLALIPAACGSPSARPDAAAAPADAIAADAAT